MLKEYTGYEIVNIDDLKTGDVVLTRSNEHPEIEYLKLTGLDTAVVDKTEEDKTTSNYRSFLVGESKYTYGKDLMVYKEVTSHNIKDFSVLLKTYEDLCIDDVLPIPFKDIFKTCKDKGNIHAKVVGIRPSHRTIDLDIGSGVITIDFYKYEGFITVCVNTEYDNKKNLGTLDYRG